MLGKLVTHMDLQRKSDTGITLLAIGMALMAFTIAIASIEHLTRFDRYFVLPSIAILGIIFTLVGIRHLLQVQYK